MKTFLGLIFLITASTVTVPVLAHTCESVADCPDSINYQCISNRCIGIYVGGACQSDSDCGVSERCIDGRCIGVTTGDDLLSPIEQFERYAEQP